MSTRSFKDKAETSKSLLILAMLFNTIVMAANFVGQKPLVIFGLIVSAGSAIFPLTYLISVLVTDIFGREAAKSMIKIGLICNILVAFFISQSVTFPYPEFWNNQPHYEVIMEQMWKIFIFSSLAYILSEYTNVNVFTYLSKKCKGTYFRTRVFCSTVCAVVIDTVFLIPIMIKSSPTYLIIFHKVVSLVLFKCCFIFLGLLFISYIRDYVNNNEMNRRKLASCSYDELENEAALHIPSNVSWFRSKKR